MRWTAGLKTFSPGSDSESDSFRPFLSGRIRARESLLWDDREGLAYPQISLHPVLFA